MAIKQMVVRSYRKGYGTNNNDLAEALSIGWLVKHITPFVLNGTTEYVEYILEKEDKK